MENNKNSMANVLLIVVTIAAVLMVGFLIFGNSGVDVTDKKPISASQGVGNLSDENQNDLAKKRQAFFAETKDLRQDIYKKRGELQSELAKKNPDAQKAAALQKDVSKLTEEFDQKRLDFILKMKKTNPDMGRIGGWGGKDEDVADCPNYGHHLGRWKGYGMGPGMMGRGYGMGPGMRGPGYGMGPGMMGDDDGDWNCPYDGRSMGSGRGYGMMGRGYGMGSGMMMGRG